MSPLLELRSPAAKAPSEAHLPPEAPAGSAAGGPAPSAAGGARLPQILGPNGPFTNLPPSIEAQVDWIGGLIGEAERSGVRTIEPTPEAEAGWTTTCEDIANATLFPQADSGIFGATIPGKRNAVMFYMAGHGAYREKLGEVAGAGYEGFELTRESEAAGV